MTAHELAERDLKKARINYLRAKNKPHVNEEEVIHLSEILALRDEIANVMRRAANG